MLVRFDPYLAPSIHGSSWAFSSDPLPEDWEDTSHDDFFRLYTSVDTNNEEEARAMAIVKFTAYLEDLEDRDEGFFRHLIPFLHEPDQVVEWSITNEAR